MRAGLLFILSFSLSASAAPQIAWTARYAFGTNSDSKVLSIALDAAQNLIVAGTSKNDQGNADYVTAKYTPTGSNLWTRRHDSGGADQVRGLAVDSEGDAVLTGTSVTIKYGSDGALNWTAPYGGRGVAVDGSNNVAVTGFSEVDFATVKLTPQGSNVWLRTHDRVGKPDISHVVTMDTAGNVYVAGTETFQSDRLYCCYSQFYVARYDASGNQQWIESARYMVLDLFSEVIGLRVDGNGNVIFTGNCKGSPTWKYFAAKFTGSGQVLWSRLYQPTDGEGVRSMVIDETGYVYLTGGLYGFLEDDHVYYKTFKIAPDNSTVWEGTYSHLSAPSFNRAQAIALDSSTNVYVTGQSTGSGTASDWATIKYSPSGQEQWVVRYDGSLHGEDQATAIAVDNTGAIYAGGFTTTTNGIEMLVIKYVELQNIQVQTNQSVLLQFLGTPGQNYRFQSTTNFSDWDDLGAAIADPLGLYQWLDTNPPVGPCKFYRTLTP